MKLLGGFLLGVGTFPGLPAYVFVTGIVVAMLGMLGDELDDVQADHRACWR